MTVGLLLLQRALPFASSSLLEALRSLIADFEQNLRLGWLLFGSPLDIVRMVVDILVTSFVIYFILKVMADTRAWQLFKGILFILFFAAASDLIGLQTINYLLVNSISVLAIGFVVIFQPELRRALETVGRNSLRLLFTSSPESDTRSRSLHNIIESIVIACEHMALTYTGALILIERETKLGELVQGTAVVLDSELSSTLLEQIFYKGAPLHDGAVLIRGDRVHAARVHVPLSDNYHLRRDYGTRHRAAVGASEIGDTISVVVSEERGTISLAMGGRLYPMRDGDVLRSLLHRLLTPSESANGRRRGTGLRGMFSSVHSAVSLENEDLSEGATPAAIRERRSERRSRLLLRLGSVGLAIALWIIVQVNVNPIEELSLQQVPIQVLHSQSLMDELNVNYSRDVNVANLRIRVRQHYSGKVTRDNVVASIDFNDLDRESIRAGLEESSTEIRTLPVKIEINDLSEYAYQVILRYPTEQLITFYEVNQEPTAGGGG
ncbi:MAG: diadenylate cyclase CdaA [Bacillota bacterium]|nr:diadenylate cyclase CdaA [Bacillota bacterium]